MIVISSALALTLASTSRAHLPVIGWNNLVTVDNIEADSEDADFPVTNLANPSTALLWKSESTAVQYVTVEHASAKQVDYIAVARHNFGSAGIAVTVETLAADDGATWQVAVEEQFIADDSPALFRYTPAPGVSIRLKLDPTQADTPTAPQAAVLYTGSLLECQRSVQPGHVPLPYGKRRTIINNRSEDGEFLGNVQTGEGLTTSVEFQNFDPDWFRENFAPFLDAAPPFFFSWHPSLYPDEVGFGWLTNDPQPALSDFAGRFNVTLQMDGLAL
jgi:hypothetical protein